MSQRNTGSNREKPRSSARWQPAPALRPGDRVAVIAPASGFERADFEAGLALIANGLSGERRRYLDAGGLGILIGDGKLPHPASERIVETYYSLHVATEVHLTLDYQWISHPAYNTDRGPVSVFAVRVHAEF